MPRRFAGLRLLPEEMDPMLSVKGIDSFYGDLQVLRGISLDVEEKTITEPSLGLMPLLTETIFQVISEIKAQGVTVLLVEQNVGETLAIADRYYVLETGRITHTGFCEEFIQHEELRRAYLGW